MKSRSIHFSILGADLFWIPLAFLGSFFLLYQSNLRHGISAPIPGSFLLIVGVSCAIWFLLYQVMDLDCLRGGWQMSAMISRTSMAVMILLAAILSWGYYARLSYSRLVLLFFGILLWAGTTLIRFSVYGILRAQVRAGRTRKVVLIGDSNLSREIAYRIRRHPEFLYEIVGFLSPFGSAEISNGSNPVGGSSGLSSLNALDLLKRVGVQEVIMLPKYAPGLELQNFLVRCQEAGIHIHVLPQPYELYVSRPRFLEIDGIPLIFLERPAFSQLAAAAKRIFDLALVLLLFIPAMIILVATGGILWMRERRFLRKEVRCGRQGRPFAMYRLDIETDDGKASAFHMLLHRLSISELPQLFNVLRDEMSLVGPRPESPERVRDYSEWQKQRLRVKPGMTGLAQVNGLREGHSSEEKTRHDLEYTLHWTPILDLVLLLQTVWTLVGRLMTHQKDGNSPLAKRSSTNRQEASRSMAQSIGE